MSDARLPEALLGRPPGRGMKRKRSDANFEIASDADGRFDRIKRQNNSDGYDSGIDLIPSHQTPDGLGSAATRPALTVSEGEPQLSPYNPVESILAVERTIYGLDTQAQRSHHNPPAQSPPNIPGLQYSKGVPIQSGIQPRQAITSRQLRPDDEGKAFWKWDPKVWDEDEFDTDEEGMSLAIVMKLTNELSLLKSFLGIYRRFNIHLGGRCGFCRLI